MKKVIFVIFLLSTITLSAQFKIEGTMVPATKSTWVILYKVEGTKQKFIKNTTIKVDSVAVDNKKQAIGTFSFTLPKNAKVGAYRISYRLKGGGFVDFFFNKEPVSFGFHPDYPSESVTFSNSKENSVYANYLAETANARKQLDSIQVASLNNPEINYEKAYGKAYEHLNKIFKDYQKQAKGMYIAPFVKASFRAASKEIITSPNVFISSVKTTFFDNINFNDKILLKSSFLVDKITDYTFYVNYSNNVKTQKRLYKESVNEILPKIENSAFKKEVIEYLINKFEDKKNIELIDFLLENHYSKLPVEIQDKAFKKEKIALLAAEVGRIAPDFSWKEGDKTLKISTLKDKKNYLLIFWSTACSHCVREVPQVHAILEEKDSIGVVAFALEKDSLGWESFKPNLPGWHHVLGLKKWKNKVARTYNIYATPSYFILDENKKIIAKPEDLKEVKEYFKDKN